MNKNKIYYLLLGIGLGVIITSSMNIAFNKTETIEYSEEEIKEKATELGMISMKDNIEKNEEEENKEAVEQAETTKDKEEALKKKTEIEKANKEKAEKEKLAEEENKSGSANISVTSDDGASSVIEKLKSNDIIEDEKEFRDLVTKYNLEKKFRTGEYQIDKNASYADILKTMIREDELKDAGFL